MATRRGCGCGRRSASGFCPAALLIHHGCRPQGRRAWRPDPSLRGALAAKQSTLRCGPLDCFTFARNDGEGAQSLDCATPLPQADLSEAAARTAQCASRIAAYAGLCVRCNSRRDFSQSASQQQRGRSLRSLSTLGGQVGLTHTIEQTLILILSAVTGVVLVFLYQPGGDRYKYKAGDPSEQVLQTRHDPCHSTQWPICRQRRRYGLLSCNHRSRRHAAEI